MIQQRNEENSKRYDQERRKFKKLCRTKKRERMEEKLRKREENYRDRGIRNFYQEVKKQKAGYQQKTVYCKNKEGLFREMA